MTPLLLTGLGAAAGLAFANGANDISKSIATLVGTGQAGGRRAVVWASLAVAAGATLSAAWAVKMTLLFTKGLLSPGTQVNQAIALAILGGAVGWVLLATRMGWPVSTTHAIVGSVVLTGMYAFGFDHVLWGKVTRKIALPLLLSPVVAFGSAWAIFRSIKIACAHGWCACPNWAHWTSALSSAFARGLNDTPKIAALGLFFYAAADPGLTVPPRWFFLILAAANALGGIIMGLRVTETLAHGVTRMTHQEGLAANLATASLVVATAVLGLPVSTTHVSSSAIMGMGLTKGRAGLNWGTVGQILTAWLVTLPVAGLLGIGCLLVLRAAWPPLP